MLSHRGAGDDIGYRLLDVLFDESTESGVIELGRFNNCIVVGFPVRDDFRTGCSNRRCTEEKEKNPKSRASEN